MAHTPLADVLGCVRTMLAAQRADAMTDRQLLADFVERRDECAFAALVHRHGAMVHNVCRRTLRDATDAEDAFQATFLVLARKATSIRKAEALGNWLHHVAYRVALKLRTDRRRREQGTAPLVEVTEPDNTTADVTWREVRGILDEELIRLPETYRAPLVLCYLEGKTQDEAAVILGWTLGTLRGRLQRGRERLRGRLERRGLPLSAVLLGGALVNANACGTASAALEVATVKAALLAAANDVAATAASAQAVALADAMIRSMFVRKVQLAAVLALGLALLGGGGLLTYESASNTLQASVSVVTEQPALADDITERGEIIEVRRFTEHGGVVLPGGKDFRWVPRVVLTPDGRYSLSAGVDAIRCWDLEGGEQVRVFGQLNNVNPIAARPPDLNSVSVQPPQPGPSVGPAPAEAAVEPRSYWALALSKDGRRLIAGSNDGMVRVFDVRPGTLVHEWPLHHDEVWGAALVGNGDRAVTGAWDQLIRLWDVESGKDMTHFGAARENVRCLALSPDQRFIAAGLFPETEEGRKARFLNVTAPGTIRLWDVQTGDEVRAFRGHVNMVSSVAFSPDGTRLVSSSYDKTIRLWDVETGLELRKYTGHAGPSRCSAFTPDGCRIVSCSDEPGPTLKVWDATTGRLVAESAPVAGGFLSLAVRPNGHECVTTGKDGTVRLWRWTK